MLPVLVVEGEVLLDHQVVDLDVSESRHEGFDRRPGILRRRGGRACADRDQHEQ